MKKVLIVHPSDLTTSFLKGIYRKMKDTTVISGGVSKSEIREAIDTHTQVILLGHGTQLGLFGSGQFPIDDDYIIDETMVESLKRKKNLICIWCYADQFLRRHNLKGFYTGMFISSVDEMWYNDICDANYSQIMQSNYGFAAVLSRHINEPLPVLYQNLLIEYGKMAQTNPIAAFNFKRLYLALPQEPVIFPDIVHNMN